MRVAIEKLRALMSAACRAADVPEQEIALVVEHYLAGELRGKTSHGVAKFCFESRFFRERQAPPEVVRERGVFAVIDAHREIGPLSAAFAVQVALDRAARHGAGFVGVINTQRYGILSAWSEEIARHGLLGIATNTSRAEAVVAGGRTPVLGVNPLAFALPTLGEPLSADMSTTLAPMGVLWECRCAGQPLPDGCFADADGRLTDDPDRAVSAVVFGEHRGYAVSLLLQAFTGSLFGFPMSSEVADTWTTGYTFIALDPAFANPDGQAAAANSHLVEQLRAARNADGGALRLPGEHGRARAAAALAAGTVEVSEQVLARLRSRASGDFNSN
ncbi:Ldh family oxidoreductase [Sphaerisporangium sp. NPDC051017]|uniref:Ldh family oxidoreductase n=1 Tax=Sphaerisporangium sp. NPDC051017 TaxID=3154636 RepID=UPI003421F96E